jgi:hypothetical protein
VKQRWAVKPPPPLNEHEAAYIEHGRMKAWVDRKVLPLILACWRRGWETDMCCEAIFPRVAFINFSRCSFLLEFAKTVSRACVDLEEVEKVVQDGVLDAGYLRLWGYNKDGALTWISEAENCVLFPVAYVDAFTRSIQGSGL